MRLKWLLAAALCCAAAMGMTRTICRAAVAPPISPDRPGFSEGVDIVPVGMTQLEMGYMYTRTGAESDQSLGNFLLRIPVSTHCEARIGLNSYDITRLTGGNASGFEDIDLGLKYNLIDNDGKVGAVTPTTSVILLTSLPTGATPYRSPTLQPTIKLCTEWSLTDQLTLSNNVDYSDMYDPAGRFSQWAISTSVGYSLSPKWEPYFEYYGSFPGSKGGPNSHFLDTGASYQINSNLQADAEIGKGINGIPNEFFWGTGLSVRW